jgi:GAF domain-containing protein
MTAIDDPLRLAALDGSGLLGTPREESFDRLTRLVAKVLHAPVALISLVAGDHQFFKSCVGLPEPWASARRTPLLLSFCRHVVTSDAPLVVADARTHPLVRENEAINHLKVIAYAGVPLVTPEGLALGALCAIDSRPRDWAEDEVGILRDLAASVMAQVQLLAAARAAKLHEQERARLAAQVEHERRRIERVLRRFRSACASPPPGRRRRDPGPGDAPA